MAQAKAMRRVFLFLFWITGTVTLAQETDIKYNKLLHDFDTVYQGVGEVNYDFIFKNTGQVTVAVGAAKADCECVSPIATKSEVLPDEYGFVKVRFTPTETGQFNEWIMVTVWGGGVEVTHQLYIRGMVVPGVPGNRDMVKEAFLTDSEISTTVQVSPTDIENLEVFGSNNFELRSSRIDSSLAEIGYLKKQLNIKSDLIVTLTRELKSKQAAEKNSLVKLEELSQTIQNLQGSDSIGGMPPWEAEKERERLASERNNALDQIGSLSTQLYKLQNTDSLLRYEIAAQEDLLMRLQVASDSSKQEASRLAVALAEKFQAEAQALEKAERLEKELQEKVVQEEAAQATIDSLQLALQTKISEGNESSEELESLNLELQQKIKEDSARQKNLREQEAQLAELQKENSKAREAAEALAQQLKDKEKETAQLTLQLASTNASSEGVRSTVDSLLQEIDLQTGKQDTRVNELTALKQQLGQQRKADSLKRLDIAEREQQLQRLETESQYGKQQQDSLTQLLAQRDEASQKMQQELAAKEAVEKSALAALDSLQDVMDQGESLREAQNREIEALKKELANNTKANEDRQSNLQEKEAQLERLEAETKLSQESLQQLEEQLAVKNNETEQLQQSLKRKTEDELLAQGELDRLKKELGSKKKSETVQARQMEELKKELEASRVRAGFLADDIRKKEDRLGQLALKNENSQKEVQRLMSALSERSAESDGLRKQIDAINRDQRKSESEILRLNKELDVSRDSEMFAKNEIRNLEGKLSTSELSGEYSFEEMKNEVSILQRDLKAERVARKLAEQKARDFESKYKSEQRARRDAVVFAEEMQEVAESEIEARKKAQAQSGANSKTVASSSVVYRVQILTSEDKIANNSSRFKGRKDVIEYRDGNDYKYAVGNQTTLKGAVTVKQEVKKLGFESAFVVAFKNGKRVTLKQALEAQKGQ